ncbi:mechanosensitive ion channel domain-containing protein [Paraglaciecola sp. 25GB23A]|uniref:mechanosensitive ion channel family protein n=1 Tax=Paraglaciecola sp. 25GB23A TaxID=3156068 RepID=UPI0032AF27DA
MKANDIITQAVIDSFAYFGLKISQSGLLFQLSALLVIFCLAWISFKLMRMLLRGNITQLVLRTKNVFDDELHKHHFFRRASHLAPALLIHTLCPLFITKPYLVNVIQKVAVIYALVTMVRMASALLNTIEDTYNASNLAKKAPITGFIQVGKLFVVIVALVLVISSVLDKSPLLLLSGLGAVTAILLLLFRDTILGFVAGIQIAANRMVNTGDWISMPKFEADGEVLQVGLTTVKVQNWDKTITTIPTYALIAEPVKNWRGMSESGGRRIKRAINIDVQSVQFCDEATLEEFAKIRYIKSYIQKKKDELQAFNSEQKIEIQDLVNSRRLTNIGTLRAYIQAYLSNHPKLNQDMTLMVRQLPPTELGMPLEIYCFSADKNWVNYEGIQADIFDHLLAILPVFKLRAYQRMSDRP